MLRVSLECINHSKWHQAITYALEAVVEEALKEDFGAKAQEIICRQQNLGAQEAAELLRALDEITETYEVWNAKQRERHLRELLLPLGFRGKTRG
jgi:hypothetical protein